MIITPNQPILFKYCNQCDCQGDECANTNHIAETTDDFSFQVEDADLFLGDELLMVVADWIGDFEDGTGINGGLWDDGGADNWIINNVAPLAGIWDVICSAAASAVLHNTTNLTSISTGDWVRFSFLHSALSAGNTLDVYYYVGGLPVLLVTLTGALAAGEYFISFQAPGAIQKIGFVYTNTAETSFQLDNISIKKYDFSRLKIYNCCENNELMGYLDISKITIDDDMRLTFGDV